tara:strand:+ start:309 stop:605 length:297 start_codon:yes stop_codon:yes gene_type:complete
MNLIKRRARTIPFGYKVSDDSDYIEPVQEELDALDEAREYLNNCSYREVADWITRKTGRSLTHTGLKKIVDNRWIISNHLNQKPILEEKEELSREGES